MSTAQPARKRVSMVFAGLGAAAVIGGSLIGPIATASAQSCPDVEVVFARGTNEAPGVGQTGQAFVDALTSRLPGKSVDVYAVNYPASYDFSQVIGGVTDAATKLESTAASCPATKMVLGGYSQGAAVAGYTTTSEIPAGYELPPGIPGLLPASVAPHVAAVTLFGTPKDWVVNLADRNAPPMVIGRPYSAKTLELCAPGDPICAPGGFDRAAHSSYKDNGMADQAADFVARQLGGARSAV